MGRCQASEGRVGYLFFAVICQGKRFLILVALRLAHGRHGYSLGKPSLPRATAEESAGRLGRG